MTNRIKIVVGIVVGVVLSGSVVLVFFLRQQNLAGLEQGSDTLLQRSDGRRQPNATDATPQQLKDRADAAELEKALPKDIRETWTPEFKAEMEAPSDRPSIRNGTNTQ